jgi:hypothetical protein
MPADDLVAAVALDLLGAAVPAAHHAGRVEHEHGVVDHALDQQAEALLALAQGLLVQAPLGQVARHLGEAEQAPGLVAQRGDHDVRPEALAVPLHPPPLVLEAAFARRDLQLALRPAAVERGLGIEHREMPADDLLGRVALDELRAAVPAHDAPPRVEQEHGVVLDLLRRELEKLRFDHQLELDDIMSGIPETAKAPIMHRTQTRNRRPCSCFCYEASSFSMVAGSIGLSRWSSQPTASERWRASSP